MYPARLACLIATFLCAGAAAAEGYDYRALYLLQDSRTHAIIRVSEPPDGGDPPERGRADCSSVETLSRRGRNIARAFGRMFQQSAINFQTFLTSRLCRNIEAARLMALRPSDESPLLDPAPDTETAERRADDIIGMLDGMRRGETALLLTHPDIVEALIGESLSPGEGLVFRVPPFGEPELRTRFDLPPQ